MKIENEQQAKEFWKKLINNDLDSVKYLLQNKPKILSKWRNQKRICIVTHDTICDYDYKIIVSKNLKQCFYYSFLDYNNNYINNIGFFEDSHELEDFIDKELKKQGYYLL